MDYGREGKGGEWEGEVCNILLLRKFYAFQDLKKGNQQILGLTMNRFSYKVQQGKGGEGVTSKSLYQASKSSPE